VIRRRDGVPVRIVSASCTEHRVRVEIRRPEPHVPEAHLQVVVPVLPAPRAVEATLEIITDAPGGRIHVPIRVRGR
jgi:hypothetical protein